MNVLQLRSTGLAALLIVVLQSGCTGIPDGAQAVSEFELDRYLGKWYEIARLDHSFERGLTEVSATYSLRDDGGVKVLNRGYDAEKGEWEEATGKAYFVGSNNVGALKVSFFGPFYGGYNIVELDKDSYEYALVVGPNRSYLWLLARSPKLEEEIMSRLIQIAQDLGFATDKLIYVEQSISS